METIRYPKCRPARNAIPRTVVKTPPSEELLLRSSPPRGKIALPHQHHSFCVLWLLPSPLLARMVLSSTVDCPQLMEVAHANLNQDTCPPQGGPQTFAVISLPKESSSPEPDSFDRVHTFPKAGGEGLLLHPRNAFRWIKLVSPFVVAFVPSTTCSTQTSLPLPCSRLARSPGSYSDHTPTLRRLNHLADYCQAPGTSRHPQCFPG